MAESIGNKKSDEVLGSIPVEMKGFILSKPYTLVFTQDKTVFARITSKIMKEHAKNARESAENSGGGRLEKMKRQMGAHFSHHQKYLDMTIEEILAEDDKNFAIDNSEVRKVKVRERTVDYQGFPETELRILIKTTGKKYKLRVNEKIDNKEALELFKRTHGSKVKSTTPP
ncbi:hypothetical protein [Methanonatronarchaeum sp. AMET6-2]|uniref:hypothetical protein n=1 Tax=Methanonatronarchaeum sp. AMET6-2 TaxID=2933293 RepID=UPI0012025D8E|nr:hypothetical protein [Methanonatronarchaeum sp. AMET6-2]RZN61706.1 MAG: hypothetical protein EF811_04570 [Methanonatronarchaeia archaeon]UOY10138.1 hypothetical protein MU439_00415 [Methanonatronarchaeum sp. AMET6-2]